MPLINTGEKSSRRPSYIIALGLIVLALLAVWLLRPAPRPDLIIVLWDCVRADHISHLGYNRPTSPTLDRLAREGVSLARTTSEAPWTLPAVTALFTGLPPWQSGAGLSQPAGRNLDLQAGEIGLPRLDKPMLVDWLAENGYRTSVISGNIYIGGQFFKGRKVDELIEGKGDAKALTDKALALLNQRGGDKPRALYLHLMDAHFPTWPPEKYRKTFLPRPDFTLNEKMKSWDFPNPPADKNQRAALKHYRTGKISLYDGAIRYLDDQLARLCEWAKAHNAVVVVLGDHGEEFWEHQELEKAIYQDPRGISGIGHGHALFQELLHVPCVIWQAGLAKGLSDKPAGLIDIWPTLAGLLDIPPPPGLPGRDLLAPQPTDNSTGRVMLSGGIGYGNAKYSALEWPWKLIVSQDEAALLFDLSAEPKERTNKLGDEPDTAERLFGKLAPIFEGRASDKGRSLEVDEGTARRLKALGYM